jgi:endonuclease/exonuclease/phosphatase family metal-dependent hydrolase
MVECTVMTWNVENFFPSGTPSGPPTKAVYTRKLQRLAATISAVNPDVLAMQEVGGPQPLADLQAALEGKYPNSAISLHPDGRGIRVALLARRALTDVRQLHDFTSDALPNIPTADGQAVGSLGRGALHAVVRLTGNRRLRIVTAHLKSKLLSYPDGRRFPLDEHERARGAGFALIRRSAEAVALRVYLNNLMTGDTTPTVLVGDLNDEPHAVTTELLQGPPDGAPDRPDSGDDVRLNNLADWLPRKHQFSRLFEGSSELIDHILVSQDLLRSLRQVDALVDDITSITEDLASRKLSTIPDHAPMFARFDLP